MAKNSKLNRKMGYSDKSFGIGYDFFRINHNIGGICYQFYFLMRRKKDLKLNYCFHKFSIFTPVFFELTYND